jgi:DNA-binding IclR family transcriptional regulator
VRDPAGQVGAAVSVVGTASTFTLERVAAAMDAVLRACCALPTAVTGNQQSNTDQQMSFLNR